MTAVEQEIRGFLSDNFPLAGAGRLDADESLIDSGFIDSLGVLELVEFVESHFRISVPDDELLPEHFDSVTGITRYVSGRLAA
jgi:acyl carrier protein